MKFTKNYPDYDVEVVHCTYVTQEKIVIKKTMFYLKYEKKSKNNLGLIYFRKKRGKNVRLHTVTYQKFRWFNWQ